MTKDQNIWKWENTAHITKMSIEGLVALASLAGAITAILIATKVIAGPASLALVASPAGIAVLFIAAVYFAALACSSYQQMHKNEGIGVNGKDGKDADFSVLLRDELKSGTIVEETVKDKDGKDVKQLNLKLSGDGYQALVKGSSDGITLYVLLAGKSVGVNFNRMTAADGGGNYKLPLTSVNSKDTVDDMKAELGMAADSKSLKVAVSDKDLETLKNEVSTKLGEVAVNAALSKIAK